jgi:hypothetical protein
MGKKLKITEEQLKRLVSSKNQMSENMDSIAHEGQMNEVGVGSIEMGLAKEVAPIIMEKLKELGIVDVNGMNVEMFSRALQHEISNYKDDNDSEKYEMPGYKETMDDLNNLSIRGGSDYKSYEDEESMNNQVYESIRNNFKRFL